MDKINNTLEENTLLAIIQDERNSLPNNLLVHRLLEWIGTNHITYDGYKLWKRSWFTRDNPKSDYYNTKQLIEQFLNETT